MRLDYRAISPEPYKALAGVNAAIIRAGLDRRLMDLLFLRVSQINGCSYCVDQHARDLRAEGETNERLDGLAGWRESPYFTEGEKAALAAAKFAEQSNRESFVAIQIETAEALAECEQIAAIEGVDLLFVGPADLSQSLGILGQFEHPRLREAIERIAASCDAAGVAWGCLPLGLDYTRAMIRRGCRLLELGSDIGTIRLGLQASATFAQDLLCE